MNCSDGKHYIYSNEDFAIEEMAEAEGRWRMEKHYPIMCQCQRERMEDLDRQTRVDVKTCEQCGFQFRPDADHSWHSVCSDACRTAYNKQQTMTGAELWTALYGEAPPPALAATPLVRSCVTCEREFKPVRPEAVYCSGPCFDAQPHKAHGRLPNIPKEGTYTIPAGEAIWSECRDEMIKADLAEMSKAYDKLAQEMIKKHGAPVSSAPTQPDPNEHPLLKRARERREAEDKHGK